ncbi:sensor histidine kinase [Cytobacillus purgationiresistens]|uniref:histidine kinase n=1 Tax=Cytobacillus purgationiresistens TaxID=863449 RepID=A0ABU0AKW8_9BACI|nr:HAMP domain-containing sensor histidine kinase [Cytobacillus purgationiresistens]MDQ0271917.1 signal transduction histidine kinase [Cytobacillus purgationiresistens]
MKWKITARYLISVLSIVFIVIFVNTFILIGMLFYQQTRGIDEVSSDSGETFTREFNKYFSLENGQPVVSDEGLEALHAFGGWLQILDKNGQVLSSALAPNNVPTHYSPIELVHKYKYMDDEFNTYFIGEFESYSYLIAVPNSKEERAVFMVDAESILSYATKSLIAIIIVDLLIAMLVGLLFSTVLTKPVSYLIDRISQLKTRNFSVQETKRPGIYKPVFANLNDVSKTLQTHEEERLKLENMRDEWISNVSHDLKTPLASIQGYAELLRDLDVSQIERLEYAEVIERQSIYMKDLLDDFNLTMRLRNQDMPLTLQETRLESFVREIVIDLLNDPQFGKYEISFTSASPDLKWNIDRHLMKRAILNFVYNALIHNDETVAVTIRVTADSISIEDNGKGIAERDLEQIFERYYRGTNTENIRGTGLGMAISRDIVEAHDGSVSLSSKVGIGTAVEIRLSE